MYIKNEDTICAPATVPGTGAITVIRISGQDALEIADKVVSCSNGSISSAKGYSLKFGTVREKDGTPVDEVLASIFRSPHSYTGEDSVEISCHASSYIAGRILSLLIEAGARTAEPGEFTQRAYLNGKMDLTQAEAVADLIASQSAAAHRIAFRQMKGGFSSELKDMRSELLKIVSLMELELDFSEEEVEFADRHELNALVEKVIRHVERLVDSFRLGNAIKNGIPTAIAGATNAGKSTLLNALLGEDRAIVSDIHGTTRDTIEETLNIDGILFRFIDTAGIRDTTETVEKIGIERTFRKIDDARIVLGVLDATKTEKELRENLGDILSHIDPGQQELILLLNKADTLQKATSGENSGPNKEAFRDNKKVTFNNISVFLSDFEDYYNEVKKNGVKEKENLSLSGTPVKILEISAKNGTGIDELKACLHDLVKDIEADSETSMVTNIRHAEALASAKESLERVRSGLADGIPTDLVSQDIREAIYTLGSILGEISTDEVLGNIFRNFCIGK